jgi:hypothetical protein
MSSNSLFQTITVLILLAHVAVLLWAVVWRRGNKLAAWLNLAIAAGVWLYWIPRFGQIYQQEAMLLVFELATAAVSLAVLRGVRFAPYVMWFAFAIHSGIVVAAVIFAFTFTMKLM